MSAWRVPQAEGGYPLNIKEVTASRGKIVRDEPIAALFSQGRVSLVGRFQELEYQLAAKTTAGYRGDKSLNRPDAMIWGLTALFPAMAREAQDAASGKAGQLRQRDRPNFANLGYANLKQRGRERPTFNRPPGKPYGKRSNRPTSTECQVRLAA